MTWKGTVVSDSWLMYRAGKYDCEICPTAGDWNLIAAGVLFGVAAPRSVQGFRHPHPHSLPAEPAWQMRGIGMPDEIVPRLFRSLRPAPK